MNIILGEDTAEELRQKHIVLELDTFRIAGRSDPVKAFCVTEDLSMSSLMVADQMQDLHQGLLRNYRKRNWNYCHQALKQLQGQWDGQLDSFYNAMHARIVELEKSQLDADWDGAITK